MRKKERDRGLKEVCMCVCGGGGGEKLRWRKREEVWEYRVMRK